MSATENKKNEMGSPKVEVTIRDSKVENGVIGTGNVTNNITKAEKIHNGDNFSGNNALKVGGDVKELQVKTISENQPMSANSETREDAENVRLSQDRMDESMYVAREVEEAVEAVYAYERDECRHREMCRSTIACLTKLGVCNLTDLNYIEIAELVESGIKLVQAKKLKLHCKVDVSAGKTSVKTEVDPEDGYIKTEDGANRKRPSSTGRSKASNKRK